MMRFGHNLYTSILITDISEIDAIIHFVHRYILDLLASVVRE